MGFDLLVAEILIELKKKYANIYIEGAKPCINQTNGWGRDYVIRYNLVLNNIDKTTLTSNFSYYNGCYQIRNKYMVDSSDLVVGCQLNKSAGTESTINYAIKKNKNIILIKS